MYCFLCSLFRLLSNFLHLARLSFYVLSFLIQFFSFCYYEYLLLRYLAILSFFSYPYYCHFESAFLENSKICINCLVSILLFFISLVFSCQHSREINEDTDFLCNERQTHTDTHRYTNTPITPINVLPAQVIRGTMANTIKRKYYLVTFLVVNFLLSLMGRKSSRDVLEEEEGKKKE